MRTCVLSSGSKGNTTYIESNNKRILIDLGNTCSYVEKQLKAIDVAPETIDAVFITHTHTDHIQGLRVFCKKYHPLIYLTNKMLPWIEEIFPLENYQTIENDFFFGDIFVRVLKTSHDVDDSNGYIFESDNKSVVYITDTGYIHQKYHSTLKNRNIYIMESNHDIEKLMNGSYPYHLKQRILSDNGHLSNKDSSYYLSKFIGENTDTVILAHLSEENNDPNIALTTLNETLKAHQQAIKKVIVAKQNERTELLEI